MDELILNYFKAIFVDVNLCFNDKLCLQVGNYFTTCFLNIILLFSYLNFKKLFSDKITLTFLAPNSVHSRRRFNLVQQILTQPLRWALN